MPEAKPIGETLPDLLDSATIETGSSAPSTRRFSDLDLSVLERIPARLSDGLMAHLEVIANFPLPAEDACDDAHFAKVMRSMSILARRSDDEVTGKLRINLYQRMLGGYSDEAISYLCEQSLAKFTFFPSVAECLKILAAWPNRTLAKQARDKATNALRHERQTRMEETMMALMKGELDGEAIAALPEGIRSIALTRGLIWDDGDGQYRPRPDPDLAAIRERGQRSML